jgi:NADH:ubiquinone oxidoreductase subunit E
MPKKIEVCTDKTCSKRGSEQIENYLKKSFDPQNAEIKKCACTGFCEQGPNIVVDDDYIIHDAKIQTIVQKINNGDYKKIEHLSFEDVSKNDFLGDLL